MLAGDGVAVQGPWSEQFSTNDAPRFDFGEHGVAERVVQLDAGILRNGQYSVTHSRP